MFTTVFISLVFILQNILLICVQCQVVKIGSDIRPNLDPAKVNDAQEKMAMQFPKGIVPYFIDSGSYDSLMTVRIHEAMDVVEASSCVVFKQREFKPTEPSGSWVHFTNPTEERDCVHEPMFGENGEIVIVIGFDCMSSAKLLHVVLHAIGFKDEVSHPHRDQYIRILWENIQPSYRYLFRVQHEDAPYKVVEYDPMSIMHFHDRAFSMNGGPTIAPRVPGLLIAPSEKLSQLDVMRLRLWFGHECNKRKVGALLEKCKTVLHNSPGALASSRRPDVSVEADVIDGDYSDGDGGDGQDGGDYDEGHGEYGGDGNNGNDNGNADNGADGNNGVDNGTYDDGAGADGEDGGNGNIGNDYGNNDDVGGANGVEGNGNTGNDYGYNDDGGGANGAEGNVNTGNDYGYNDDGGGANGAEGNGNIGNDYDNGGDGADGDAYGNGGAGGDGGDGGYNYNVV